MCLAPSQPTVEMPKAPEPPPPPPTAVIQPGEQPTTVKPTTSARKSLQRSSRGPSSLSIPLSTGTTGGGTAPSSSIANLSIGK